MANARGSYPSFTAIGAKIAAVNNIIEIESIIMPSANQINTITPIIIQWGIPDSKKRLSIAFAKPVIASVLEYNAAVTRRRSIGPDVRPTDKIESIISQFELGSVANIPAKFLSGGQKKKLVIALALLGDPKVLLLDEPFAALDVLTIKMLKELIVNLQTQNNLSVCICDHQARDLLSCVDVAIILSNCKIIAKGTPSELVKNSKAQTAYFGESFRLN